MIEGCGIRSKVIVNSTDQHNLCFQTRSYSLHGLHSVLNTPFKVYGAHPKAMPNTKAVPMHLYYFIQDFKYGLANWFRPSSDSEDKLDVA